MVRSKSNRPARSTPSADREAPTADHPEIEPPTAATPAGAEVDPEVVRAEYEAFAAKLRGAMRPADALEELVVERAIMAAFRLHRAQGIAGLIYLGGEAKQDRIELAAERSFVKFLAIFEKFRARRRRRRADPAAEDANPDPVAEVSPTAEVEAARLADDARPYEGWSSRLEADPETPAAPALVRGTTVTADHIVSLIVDGWTPEEVLQSHVDLTRSDIRACLDYAVEKGDPDALTWFAVRPDARSGGP